MIKFLDLESINGSFQPELDEAIKRVVHSGWYLQGEEVKAFEQEYAAFIGTPHCVGVGNGLDALRLIFRAYLELGKLKPGDEIIVPANTFIASVLAISDNHLTPVLVEPDIKTYNLDPAEIEKKITSKTKGILLVHLYGQNAMRPDINQLVEKYDLLLIEDNAQAIGARNGILRTGSVGHIAAHSFYPGKNLGALGDGGAVTTTDETLARTVAALGNYGSQKKYIHTWQGINSRLDEIQAAVLRLKLKRLDSDNDNRKKIANYYLHHIRNSKLVLPQQVADHVWHLFVIRCADRDELQKHFTDHHIQTVVHYPIPPHQQNAYKELNGFSFPVTEQIHREVLSLPISPVMKEDEVHHVIETINIF